ncbi:MAG: hypothetical protein CM15mP49_05000 [Actinomycetota bacterium]|nr:MAG: hypothetical protein CM15mP49_05000 [Actinomycetota bacterium]
MLILLAICFTLIALLLVQLKRSSYGRQLSAMKDSPAASATLGLNMLRLKLSVFTLAAAIAGFGGALHASNLRNTRRCPFTVFEGPRTLYVDGGWRYWLCQRSTYRRNTLWNSVYSNGDFGPNLQPTGIASIGFYFPT